MSTLDDPTPFTVEEDIFYLSLYLIISKTLPLPSQNRFISLLV